MISYQDYRKAKKKEFEEKYKVIELLNKYGRLSLNEEYSPLVIEEEYLDIMNDLVRDKVDHIKEMIELIHGKKHFGIFASFLFKALFIGENDIIRKYRKKRNVSSFYVSMF